MPLLVNQCLKNPSDDEVRSVRDALTGGDGAEAPLAVANAEDERVPDAASGAASEKGRVLLLDDDSSFREIIRDCLAENGYTVVAVQNGGEGVREVLAGDFTLILCDFIMPGLTGDMFYRAVERIRPALCQRFVFMTGHQNDAKTNEFIKNVNGFVLRKPFPLKNLLDSIAFTEMRCTFQSVFEFSPADPALARVCTPAGGFPADRILRPDGSALAEKVAVILARAQADQTLGGPSGVLPLSEPQLRATGASRAFVFFGWALLLALVAGLWIRYANARDRVAAASAERLALDAEWASISPHLQEAASVQSKVGELRSQLTGISADRATPRWAPALRSIVACAGPEIELREVRAHEENGDAKMWTLLVGGVSRGKAPRMVADHYRLALQRELVGIFHGSVSIRFERFEDLPDLPSAPPDERRGSFKIIATIRFDEMTGPEGKEGA